MRKRFLLILVAAVLASCSSEQPEVPAPATATDSTADLTSPAPAAPILAPITSRDRADGSPIVAPGGVAFTLPGSWIAETPSSGMRLAQARIPGSAGDGQLTVFYFGPGGGGGVELNLERWLGQVEIDPGSKPSRESASYGDFRAIWIEAQGTLKPSTMGTGPTSPQPDSRLLAGVVEGPQGPWFFKATGPAETLAAERDAFVSMLKSAVPNG